MRKIRNYNFHQGLAKDLFIAILFFALQEVLTIIYPMVLKGTTSMINNSAGTLPTMSEFLLNAGGVLLMLVAVFFVSLFARNRVSVFGAKTRALARKTLYEKMTKVPTSVLYEYGTGKFLSVMTNDTTLVKYCNEQYLQAGVYFCVTILGSCIMMILLSPIYILFLLAAVLVEIGIVGVYYLIMKKGMAEAVVAYDKSFVSTRESIAGARDIRILGKLPERTKEATKQNAKLVKEVTYLDQSKHTFECINNVIFGIVTFIIILFGASSVIDGHLAEQLVIINTMIQYITIVSTATLDIFKMVINPLTRGKITYARIDEFMNLPEDDMESGTTNISTDFGTTLVLYRVSHHFWNGRKTLTNLSMELSKGKMIAVCGEAGGGKTTFVKILLHYLEPTAGVVLLNGVNLKEINKRYYRAKIISYCPTYPEFIPGTVRQNIKLFNPELTDEEILATFNEIGATQLAILPSFLDTPISTRAKVPQNIKNLINIVRCILKPAEFYVFDRSFSQMPNDIVVNVLKKLRADNKSCIFATYNNRVCQGVDEVFFSKGDHTFVKGTHEELFANDKDYATFFMKSEEMEVKPA